MKQNHFQTLLKDFNESQTGLSSLIIKAKLVYYFFKRPIGDFILRWRLKNIINSPPVKNFDRFLLDEGGMFKDYSYYLCNKIHFIKDSAILVAGTGYGKNLFQLARRKPKVIVAFDLYEYREEWEYLIKKIKESFGVDVLFFKGDFSAVPQKYYNYFDFIISDAVLEHVKNLGDFMENSRKFLKKDGIFYASFGPLWYGPGGDHITLKDGGIYNHLILSSVEYKKRFSDSFGKIDNDSCEGAFLVKEKLFSYLKVSDYFDIFQKTGFEKISAYAKISKSALFLLDSNKSLASVLDKNNVPKFDRFCSGIYLWMKLKK
ncbi:class I SAM-dependent methyltransferase [Candidatus Wolfebacteria bacterium]|nr:class I SAM-dependent methyltransferase [Candidatus Wolfebacteria bacterium]